MSLVTSHDSRVFIQPRCDCYANPPSRWCTFMSFVNCFFSSQETQWRPKFLVRHTTRGSRLVTRDFLLKPWHKNTGGLLIASVFLPSSAQRLGFGCGNAGNLEQKIKHEERKIGRAHV